MIMAEKLAGSKTASQAASDGGDEINARLRKSAQNLDDLLQLNVQAKRRRRGIFVETDPKNEQQAPSGAT
jgi:hypothetical protein